LVRDDVVDPIRLGDAVVSLLHLISGPGIDLRIAVEGGLQRVASVVVMQELFSFPEPQGRGWNAVRL
jgi:hypothetical protein